MRQRTQAAPRPSRGPIRVARGNPRGGTGRGASAEVSPRLLLPPATGDCGSRVRRPAPDLHGRHRPADNKRAPVNADKIHTLIVRAPMCGSGFAMDIKDHGHYIAGKWVSAGSGAQAEVLDPATNRPIARVAAGTKEDVNVAVEAARSASESPEWRDLDPSKRGRLLWLLGQQLRDHFEELSRLESLNVGKPLREAKGDVAYVYKMFEYYAGLADKIQGDTIPVPGSRLDYTLREPIGVTAHIAPWNYPLLLASRGLAPALAAGNTAILKPATLTPLSALKLGELAAAAGFPPGVLNVITGPGRSVGEALANHPDVDSVTFTGSTETGKQLLRIVSDRVIPTTLELGGKNPQVVLPDAK